MLVENLESDLVRKRAEILEEEELLRKRRRDFLAQKEKIETDNFYNLLEKRGHGEMTFPDSGEPL